jgi:hypothetical protein
MGKPDTERDRRNTRTRGNCAKALVTQPLEQVGSQAFQSVG